MFSLFIALIALGVAQATPADSCVALVPNDLGRMLEERFPNERLPLAGDSRDEARRYALSQGNACLLIARADFDGDGRLDLVGLLPARKAETFRLIVALNGTSGYKVIDLGSWTGSVNDLYVDVAPPGKYFHTEAYPFQPEPGAVERIHSTHQGFYFGKVEAGADVYFLSHGQWVHVHTID